MLRRLLGLLIPLLVVFAVMITVPLAGVIADRATQRVYLDRLADAERFATMADRALGSGRLDTLEAELARYQSVYGIHAWVLGSDGGTLLSSEPGPPPPDVALQQTVDLAERGVQPDPPGPIGPTGEGDLVVAVPIGVGAEAIGAVVTSSPIGALRHDILRLGRVTRHAHGDAARRRLCEEIAAGEVSSRVRLEGGPPELRRLTASFNRMADVLQRTLHRQQQFVADASHQLRTPLTSLRLALDNLGGSLPDAVPAEVTEDLGEAVEEARSMSRMLDGMLSLTRLGADPGEVEDVADVLAHGEPAWTARCAAAGLTLTVHSGRGPLTARTPAGGLAHLLDELVENACRLSGGTAVHVAARRAGKGSAAVVVVSVSDDGVGLDAEGQVLDDEGRARATSRFWRAPGQQNTAGSGLGLAVVQEFVTSVGGEVRLRPVDRFLPNPGLDVELRLVLAQPGEGGPV